MSGSFTTPPAASRSPPADSRSPDVASGRPAVSAPLPPPADGQSSDHVERRRPGRPKDVSPHLLPLLRSRPSPKPAGAVTAEDSPPDQEDTEGDDDQLRAARGILLCALVAAMFWVSLGILLLF